MSKRTSLSLKTFVSVTFFVLAATVILAACGSAAVEQQPLPPQVPLLQARRQLSLQDPTLGLDRPQGEHPARSATCPRRASH